MTFATIKMDISKKENGKHVKIGDVNIFCPTLKEITQYVVSDIAKDEKGNEIFEEGLPVYQSAEANWVQGAVLAAVKAQARNKIQPGTSNVKPGLKIPETWEELTAEGVRDGSGLALARAFKDAFKEWVSKQGLSEAASGMLITLVGNKAALQLQPSGVKDKVKARLEGFAESLSAEDLDKFERPLTAALEATSTELELEAAF